MGQKMDRLVLQDWKNSGAPHCRINPGAVAPGSGGQAVQTMRESAARFVLGLVASMTETCEEEITGSGRSCVATTRARHMAMYLMHTFLGHSFSQVAGFFGRDRTTVAHACRRVESERDLSEYEKRLVRLENLLGMYTALLAAPGASR
jgi:Bacterial dnaA protein helix-turn-helix